MAKNNPSQEFQERKQLVELQKEADLQKHKLKMKEFEYLRESDKIKHENDMTRQRIKTAEIKKTYQRKMNADWIKKHGTGQ